MANGLDLSFDFTYLPTGHTDKVQPACTLDKDTSPGWLGQLCLCVA
jgi:hypothetical protein